MSEEKNFELEKLKRQNEALQRQNELYEAANEDLKNKSTYDLQSRIDKLRKKEESDEDD